MCRGERLAGREGLGCRVEMAEEGVPPEQAVPYPAGRDGAAAEGGDDILAQEPTAARDPAEEVDEGMGEEDPGDFEATVGSVVAPLAGQAQHETGDNPGPLLAVRDEGGPVPPPRRDGEQEGPSLGPMQQGSPMGDSLAGRGGSVSESDRMSASSGHGGGGARYAEGDPGGGGASQAEGDPAGAAAEGARGRDASLSREESLVGHSATPKRSQLAPLALALAGSGRGSPLPAAGFHGATQASAGPSAVERGEEMLQMDTLQRRLQEALAEIHVLKGSLARALDPVPPQSVKALQVALDAGGVVDLGGRSYHLSDAVHPVRATPLSRQDPAFLAAGLWANKQVTLRNGTLLLPRGQVHCAISAVGPAARVKLVGVRIVNGGVFAESGGECALVNCVVSGSQGCAAVSDGAGSRVEITGGFFEGPARHGVVAISGGEALVSHATMVRSKGDGVYVTCDSRATITGATLRGCRGRALMVEHGGVAELLNTAVVDCGGHGVLARHGGRVKVTDSSIRAVAHDAYAAMRAPPSREYRQFETTFSGAQAFQADIPSPRYQVGYYPSSELGADPRLGDRDAATPRPLPGGEMQHGRVSSASTDLRPNPSVGGGAPRRLPTTQSARAGGAPFASMAGPGPDHRAAQASVGGGLASRADSTGARSSSRAGGSSWCGVWGGHRGAFVGGVVCEGGEAEVFGGEVVGGDVGVYALGAGSSAFVKAARFEFVGVGCMGDDGGVVEVREALLRGCHEDGLASEGLRSVVKAADCSIKECGGNGASSVRGGEISLDACEVVGVNGCGVATAGTQSRASLRAGRVSAVRGRAGVLCQGGASAEIRGGVTISRSLNPGVEGAAMEPSAPPSNASAGDGKDVSGRKCGVVAEGIGSGVVVLEASVLGFSVGMAAHQGGAVTHSGADVTHCAVALVGC